MNPSEIENLTCTSGIKQGPGILYIFNHKYFNDFNQLNIGKNIKLNERNGTEYDVQALQMAFKYFNVENILYNDLTLSEIDEKITEISTTDFSENSCIVVVFLTHGFRNNIIAAKDKLYCCDEMILNIQSNESLKSKQKIFLIQASRDFKSNQAYNKNKYKTIKREKVYLNETYVLSNSTELMPETQGTPFILLFCDIFREYGSKKPIGDIFDLVMISVQNRANQFPEIKRNTCVPYVFGDYCKNLDENNEKDVNCNIEDLSELELSEFDDYSKAPIQEIIKSVSEVECFKEFVKENDKLTINEKAEQFIAKFKSEDVDKWVQICPCGHTPMPENPVEGGTDIDGHPIYIGRAVLNYELLPAKVFLGRKQAFVSYNGYEHKTRDFEILTGTGFFWVPGSRGSVPSNAVKGGITCDGEILYIGRTAHDTTITPGKIHTSHGFLYIPFDGLEIRFFHYEVLVKSK